MIVVSIFVFLTSAIVVSTLSADQWRSQSIYQVLTDRFARAEGSTDAPCDVSRGVYCGGTYRGIMDKLDYIQDMGFTAIWISPITLQIQGRTRWGMAWHGYWQQDLYKVNLEFGTEDDLKLLSDTLHSRGMSLMVDVVVNHNAWSGNASSVDYSVFQPFDQARYYHDYCAVDYSNDTSVKDCWLGDSNLELVDLKTEDDAVSNAYQTWIYELVANYSIDGLRVDTAKHVDPDFWPGFNQAAGVFVLGEVADNHVDSVCRYQNHMDSVLNYPMYYATVAAFSSTSGNMSGFVESLRLTRDRCKDVTVLGSFTENHDQPRFASLTSDISLAKSVIAYTMIADGIPIMYQGQEQHLDGSADPYNREAIWSKGYDVAGTLYIFTARMNTIRRRLLASKTSWFSDTTTVLYSDNHTVAMRKGLGEYQTLMVLSNAGDNSTTYDVTMSDTGFEEGTPVVDLLTYSTSLVGSGGSLLIHVENGAPRIYSSTNLEI